MTQMAHDIAVITALWLLFIPIVLWCAKVWNGRTKPARTRAIVHPILGAMYLQNTKSWFTEEVEPFGCPGRPQLTVYGDRRGPSKACASSYRRLREQWAPVAERVGKELLEINRGLFYQEPAKALRSADEVWASSELVAIDIDGNGDLILSFESKWKDEDLWQPHQFHLIDTMHFFRNAPRASYVVLQLPLTLDPIKTAALITRLSTALPNIRFSSLEAAISRL